MFKKHDFCRDLEKYMKINSIRIWHSVTLARILTISNVSVFFIATDVLAISKIGGLAIHLIKEGIQGDKVKG